MSLEYLKKVNAKQIERMKRLRAKGYSYKRLSELFNISVSSVGYHVNPKTKERNLERAKKANIKYVKMYPEKKKAYDNSASGRRSHARSWLRKYLREGTITIADALDVIKEFK